MDILKLTKSQTRAKIIRLFLSQPETSYYLRQLSRKFRISVGNVRRELLNLKAIGLLFTERKRQKLYYKINSHSPIFQFMKTQFSGNKKIDIEKTALNWVTGVKPKPLEALNYCATRDVLSARLESVFNRLEKTVGEDAFLLTATIGEIGNNSFDHNLGNWPDIPGSILSYDLTIRKVVLADRGQGILKTLRRIIPQVKNHREALKIAFTKKISGRFPEKRGNGLKFVAKVIRDKKWSLRFLTGEAQINLMDGKMALKRSPDIKGCLAIIKY